ncbi:hypothetical protein C6P45_005270 [Maudiozyma exigua]|uniref:Methyltransferase small domain-containing protein n=1 Tax=Maudiozyma exigua TaxID=34358 RepID=A0A9P6W9I4_MAUEX|nr:hypothetical protein C6P45_005270 [Kazachstania exigua]
MLMAENRTIPHARQELRWLIQKFGSNNSATLFRACLERNRHVPLQYILGSQPFGMLDIKCKEGVLIPRWETEEWCLNLTDSIKRSKLINSGASNWKIMDLCTGSGCIPLTMINETKNLFSNQTRLYVDALDYSPIAIDLSKLNFKTNFDNKVALSQNFNVSFNIQKCNILNEPEIIQYLGKYKEKRKINILTCNPPYIPHHEFIKDVRSSVRMYEPKLALIGNLEFYKNLNDLWVGKNLIDSFVYEIGTLEQALYVQNNLPSSWISGITLDSNNKARCIFGYNKEANIDYSKIFNHFKQTAKVYASIANSDVTK